MQAALFKKMPLLLVFIRKKRSDLRRVAYDVLLFLLCLIKFHFELRTVFFMTKSCLF